jgi:inner membrane protein
MPFSGRVNGALGEPVQLHGTVADAKQVHQPRRCACGRAPAFAGLKKRAVPRALGPPSDRKPSRPRTGGRISARSSELRCPHERLAVVTSGTGLDQRRNVLLRSADLGAVRWRAGPLLAAAVALAFDAVDRRIAFGVSTTGPVDEVAHLSTAALGLLVLARFIDAPRRFYVAALIASVAIDADHIPLYLGLLGNQAHRPVTHSLSAVAVFVAAATASRRHRAVLTGVATGLVLHFARDIAEGYPGVRVFWPLQDTSWMVSYRWFLGMILVFTASRLVLVSVGRPRTRMLVFLTPSPPGSIPRSQDRTAESGDRRPGLEPQGPDLEAGRETRARNSLRSPPWCRDGRQHGARFGSSTDGGPAGARRIWFFPTRSRTRSASCGSTGRMWVAHERAASGSGEGSQNSGPA